MSAAGSGTTGRKDFVPFVEGVAKVLGLAIFGEDLVVSAIERHRELDKAKKVQTHLEIDKRGWLTHGLEWGGATEIREFVEYQAYEGGPGTEVWHINYKLS